jgi:hypothetical protein
MVAFRNFLLVINAVLLLVNKCLAEPTEYRISQQDILQCVRANPNVFARPLFSLFVEGTQLLRHRSSTEIRLDTSDEKL